MAIYGDHPTATDSVILVNNNTILVESNGYNTSKEPLVIAMEKSENWWMNSQWTSYEINYRIKHHWTDIKWSTSQSAVQKADALRTCRPKITIALSTRLNVLISRLQQWEERTHSELWITLHGNKRNKNRGPMYPSRRPATIYEYTWSTPQTYQRCCVL